MNNHLPIQYRVARGSYLLGSVSFGLGLFTGFVAIVTDSAIWVSMCAVLLLAMSMALLAIRARTHEYIYARHKLELSPNPAHPSNMLTVWQLAKALGGTEARLHVLQLAGADTLRPPAVIGWARDAAKHTGVVRLRGWDRVLATFTPAVKQHRGR